MVYLGFNQDEAGRMVFDGVMPHAAGSRKTWVNYAFGLPGKFSQAVENHYARGDQFPFAYNTLTDPLSGKADGILQKCREQKSCPKVMQLDSGSEPWAGRSSLVVTDPRGEADVNIPDNVRMYMHASAPHLPALVSVKPESCQQPSSTHRFRETHRALLVAMQSWITDGKEPPATHYPSLCEGTLVSSSPQTFKFPAIPGVQYNGRLNDLFINDLIEPPDHLPGLEYTVLVPAVDADGNDIGGVRSTTIQAPLGTYLAYNLRAPGFMEGEPCATLGLSGSYIPFAATQAQRVASGDPRLSLQERYGSHAGYVDAVTRAARRLVTQRLLLEEDAGFLIDEAAHLNIGIN